jgi:hypothetical protein
MDSDETRDQTVNIAGNPEYELIPLKQEYLLKAFRKGKKIQPKLLLNTINHLNFTGGEVFLHVASRSNKHGDFLFRVLAGPCTEKRITCTMPDAFPDLQEHEIRHLILDDGKSIFVNRIAMQGISGRSLFLERHGDGIRFSERQAKRFQCFFINAEISQHSYDVQGVLQDFNPAGLRIQIEDGPDGSFMPYMNLKEPLKLTLYKHHDLVYTGVCNPVRYEEKTRSLIVCPMRKQEQSRRKRIRNPRLNLVPTPKVLFLHPFTSKRVTYEIQDLTNSGFSVQEKNEQGLLIPGLMIPHVEILFAGGYKLNCRAQVVYARDSKKSVQFGFAIKDMDMTTYNNLFDIYSNAQDIHANVSREVDMDALWKFFFESGFIYPKKYVSLSCFRDEFKDTYYKLYHHSPEIFANFTYQENGLIYGHVSIIKSYERTWMIHHLAAKPLGRRRTGLQVLNHILNYFDGLYRMPTIGLDYMMFFFRPENKFPDYFFGGFCRELNNPKGCSIDCFGYLNHLIPREIPLPQGWVVHECSDMDFSLLSKDYERISGGLTLDALGLRGNYKGGSIESLYEKYGLKRRTRCFVLKYQEQAKAYIITDESNLGVNLSELLNGIKVIVTDDKNLAWPTLINAIGNVSPVYPKEMTSILVYPSRFLDDQKVPYDTRYNLWVLNSKFGLQYTENLKDKAKIRITKLLIKYFLSKLSKKIFN